MDVLKVYLSLLKLIFILFFFNVFYVCKLYWSESLSFKKEISDLKVKGVRGIEFILGNW